MIQHTALIKKAILTLVVALIAALALKRLDLFVGALAGVSVGLANYLFMQDSVTRIFAPAVPGEGGSAVYRLLKGYFFRFFGKLFLLTFVFIVIIKFLHVHWLGFLSGLAASMVIYISEVVAQRVIARSGATRQSSSFQ